MSLSFPSPHERRYRERKPDKEADVVAFLVQFAIVAAFLIVLEGALGLMR